MASLPEDCLTSCTSMLPAHAILTGKAPGRVSTPAAASPVGSSVPLLGSCSGLCCDMVGCAASPQGGMPGAEQARRDAWHRDTRHGAPPSPPLGDLALPHFCVLTHSAALCKLLSVCWVQVIVSHPANESSLDIAQQDDATAEDPAVTSQAAGLADVVTPAAGIDKRVAAQLEVKVRHGRAAGALQPSA